MIYWSFYHNTTKFNKLNQISTERILFNSTTLETVNFYFARLDQLLRQYNKIGNSSYHDDATTEKLYKKLQNVLQKSLLSRTLSQQKLHHGVCVQFNSNVNFHQLLIYQFFRSGFSEFQTQSLDAHNAYRNKHKVQSLKLNKDLCILAQKWAEVSELSEISRIYSF